MDGRVVVCLKGWEDVRSALRLVDPGRFGFILLHVTDIRPREARELALAGLAGRQVPPDGRLRMDEAAEESARELLAEAGGKVAAAGGAVLALQRRVGDPGPEIVRLAKGSGADLIVLWAGAWEARAGPPPPGPHHPGPHRHLSPVVHFVLTHAGCPVLVLS